MTLYLIGDGLFYPLSENYLVYICKREVYEKLSEKEAIELITKTLQGVKMGLAHSDKPEIVH